MMHDELVTYEVAKLAKDKGFPQDPKDNCSCQIYCWDDLRKIHPLCIPEMWYFGEYRREDMCAAPTQSLLQRWLREKKGIHIGIGTDGGNDWCYITVVITTGHTEYNTNIFPTYEQALEEALKYALENLV